MISHRPREGSILLSVVYLMAECTSNFFRHHRLSHVNMERIKDYCNCIGKICNVKAVQVSNESCVCWDVEVSPMTAETLMSNRWHHSCGWHIHDESIFMDVILVGVSHASMKRNQKLF